MARLLRDQRRFARDLDDLNYSVHCMTALSPGSHEWSRRAQAGHRGGMGPPRPQVNPPSLNRCSTLPGPVYYLHRPLTRLSVAAARPLTTVFLRLRCNVIAWNRGFARESLTQSSRV